jgi:hypothetical protein
MIKIKDGVVDVEGSKMELYVELSTIIHVLYERKKLSKEEIEEGMKLAFLSENELMEKIKKEAIEKISELIKELL